MPTPLLDEQLRRRRQRVALVVLGLLIFLNVLTLRIVGMKLLRGVPMDYPVMEDHFKYGSIGSDTLKSGLPYWIWKVLPDVFPSFLPQNGKTGYAAFGLIVEKDREGKPMDRPVGFSKRRIGRPWGLDLVGLNCAFCHASTLRKSEGDLPVPAILGMPAHTVDVEAFFVFLFETAKVPGFSARVLEKIQEQRNHELGKKRGSMGWFHRMFYRWILIPLYRFEIGKLEQKFCFINKLQATECEATRMTADAGPGRMDLWAPYKVQRFVTSIKLYDLLPDLKPPWLDSIDLDVGEAPGFADMAPLWQLETRMGRGFHWDGNTRMVSDYRVIAALGMMITSQALDKPRLDRILRWTKTYLPKEEYHDLASEPFNTKIPHLFTLGRQLFAQRCATCHSLLGSRFGEVEPIESIETDRNRYDAFTDELALKLTRVGTPYKGGLRDVQKTLGYINLPLDRIWLRAPYLHNGSVPTLRDLLKIPPNRPQKFCRGNDVYDWENVGFRSDLVTKNGTKSCGPFFKYDTGVKGNGNQGHPYGADLKEFEKESLLEFLKTL